MGVSKIQINGSDKRVRRGSDIYADDGSEGGLLVAQVYLVPHSGLGAVHVWNDFRAQSLFQGESLHWEGVEAVPSGREYVRGQGGVDRYEGVRCARTEEVVITAKERQ